MFAEYFINEFEDPLNAYTGGMANFAAAPALNLGVGTSVTSQPPLAPIASKSSTGLPTGGIRTTFHNSTVASAPAAKRSKPSPDEAQFLNPDISATAPTPLSELASKPALIGLAPSGLDQHQQSSHLGAQLQQQHIQLPIGVGIRLGGIGGIAAPGQHSQQQQQSGIVPGLQFGVVNHQIWGVPGINNGSVGGTETNNDAGASEQQVAERRQRNREHAKRSRVRKKFMLESLQVQVRGLQNENGRLRLLVQEHVPEHAMQIIAECCTKSHLFENLTDVNAQDSASKENPAGNPVEGELARSDYSLVQCLMAGQKCFVLSDPTLPDNPIVFATPDFYKLTGYTSKEVLGRNCRFLQGSGTDKQSVEVIRRAIATGSDATVCLLNYKADGTPFWNQFFIGALRDADNNIVNFVSDFVAAASPFF